MANTTISGLPSTSAIDPTNDFLAIDTASPSATNKINRNNLLQLASAPVGLTDSQTLTNKTITAPVLGGTITGIYTLGGTPSFPSSVATLTGSQTLTNKTLTSPIINTATISGGTIDNSTITVDSISGHTTSTIVSVGGVQMNNGVIGTTGAVTTNSIAAGAVVPNSLLASTGTGWVYQTFTPSWTNLTVGTGTNNGYYVQTGKMVTGYVHFTFGTGSSISSGGAYFNAPVAANARYLTTRHWIVGSAWLQSASGNYLGQTDLNGSGANTIAVYAASGTQPSFNSQQINNTVPATWTTNNWLTVAFTYEAA